MRVTQAAKRNVLVIAEERANAEEDAG